MHWLKKLFARGWQTSVTTALERKDLPRQRIIKIEIANIPAYTHA
jgi:hypothetical protein